MDSSSSSQSTTDTLFRSGSSTGFYTDVKEVTSSRSGQTIVIVHHGRPSYDKNEPRSSDYQHSWTASKSK
ncbi:6f53e506-7dbc-4e3f-9e57-f3f2b94532ff [Thermothielavioides terrestris]|uniref:Uncharacterized protein n=2 Tax=Thermothielavioides terrestris TaxID=2587410 RepID=G2R778_THETT|nr:uncharacterized protein THITE_2116853 [Thermothielavioides terrestris NRRL 8126]AEO67787.1 hypothetical protein THITE_2116853 [Thermothielavioides terrestris NRRL 8126]SPQ25923.1 6f53e506-7dbc-4e3f-9e57-f3f2b94532ff [Thermothielavioides terrestris]